MWIAYAFLSAVFAGVTSVLAKCGIRKTDATVATAIRTGIVLVFAWAMVLIVGSQSTLPETDGRSFLFLILSGLATGGSWLCYFKALQLGDIHRVVPVDKSSTVLTFTLAAIFFSEFTWFGLAGIVLIAVGTLLMLEKKDTEHSEEKAEGRGWFVYAAGSALFASLTAILGKIGISDVESNLGTAIRTGVVLIMAWMMVLVTGKQKELHGIGRKELGFIGLSGLATGASWLCYYKALQDGPASVVVPIDKLSIVVTVLVSSLVFGEKLTKSSVAGLMLIVGGTMLMLPGH